MNKFFTFGLALFFISSSAQAATYWDNGSFVDLKGSELNETNTYVPLIPDSFMEAKQSKECVSKFELAKSRLSKLDQENRNSNLTPKQIATAQDKLVLDLNKKFILPCLKNVNIKTGISSKTNSNSKGYEELEKRIKAIELQIKEILKALQSLKK